MDEKKTSLFIADRLVLAMEILKTISMAAENKEYFPENGQNISVVLNMAVSELRKCCRPVGFDTVFFHLYLITNKIVIYP